MNPNILRKMFISIIIIAVSTVIFGVNVYAYYGLTVSNNKNIIKAGKYSVDIEVYVEDIDADNVIVEDDPDTSDINEEVTASKIADINDVVAYNFNVAKGRNYYIKVKKSNSSNIDFKVGISEDELELIEITEDGIIYKLTNDQLNILWSRPKNSNQKFISDKTINLGYIDVILYKKLDEATETSVVRQYDSNSINIEKIDDCELNNVYFANLNVNPGSDELYFEIVTQGKINYQLTYMDGGNENNISYSESKLNKFEDGVYEYIIKNMEVDSTDYNYNTSSNLIIYPKPLMLSTNQTTAEQAQQEELLENGEQKQEEQINEQ